MKRDSYGKHKTIIVFSVVSSFIIIIFYASYLGADKYIKQTFHHIVYPIQNAWYKSTQSITGRVTAFREMSKLREELDETQKQLLKQNKNINELKRIQREKTELEKMLEYKKSLTFDSIPARIISKDPQNLFSTIILDKGKNDKVETGFPVISIIKGEECLVGKIISVSEKSSSVLTILDPRFRVSITLKKINSIGILQGQIPSSFNCTIEYLDRNLSNLEEETVITSDMGGNYPNGINIGIIVSAEKKRYGLFQKATLNPFVNYFTLDNVFILSK